MGAFVVVVVLLLVADADTDLVDDGVADTVNVLAALLVEIVDAEKVEDPVIVLEEDDEREGLADADAERLTPGERVSGDDADSEGVKMDDALLGGVARVDAVLVGDLLSRNDGSDVRVAVVVRVDVDEILADLVVVPVRDSVLVDEGDGDAVVVLLDVSDPETVREDVDDRVDVFEADADDVGAIAGPAAARRRTRDEPDSAGSAIRDTVKR